jgi:hypothetical protein
MKRISIAVLLSLAVGLSAFAVLSGCGSGKEVPVQSTAAQSTVAQSTAAQSTVSPTPVAVAVPKPQPITIMAEAVYYHHELPFPVGDRDLRLVVNARISKAEALRLHDPEGTPKKKAWHLVPLSEAGRLVFTLECVPARKDCFKMTPGNFYTLELMSPQEAPSHNKSFRFVKVNGVGVYLVGDYSYEVN